MAEQEQSGERTEQPTEKRLREARERGDVPRSRELAAAAVFGTGVVALTLLGPVLARGSLDWMQRAMMPAPELYADPHSLFGHSGRLLLELLSLTIPVVVACVLAGLAGPLLMGGLRYSAKSLTPDLQRLSPLAGIKRLYGRESVAELVRSLLRVTLVGAAAAFCLTIGLDRLRALPGMSLEQAARSGLGFAGTLLLATACALLVLAVIDAPYQKWSHARKLRMTRHELREELKESEGRPEVKGRIRQLQQQMSQRRMMEELPQADVVVTNPTHYAVALKYQAGRMSAPRLLAKGADEMAARIREVAGLHGIAIVSSPPLARALYREGEIGREIPVRLYSAVAQVLSYVYQLRTWRAGSGALPEPPQVDVDETGGGR